MELIRNERVDDIPLILNQMKKISLDEIIDQHFKAHGNWKGLSIGNYKVQGTRFLSMPYSLLPTPYSPPNCSTQRTNNSTPQQRAVSSKSKRGW